jgi:glucose uptake protein GlcU
LVSNKDAIRNLRWGVIVFVTLVQFSVFCIWIPARLQISARYIAINKVWDRIEKCLFALVDLGLNVYFLYIVKSQLIAWGLDRYKALFNFNVGMVVVSISMDVSRPSSQR